jgi:hypothetical protein
MRQKALFTRSRRESGAMSDIPMGAFSNALLNCCALASYASAVAPTPATGSGAAMKGMGSGSGSTALGMAGMRHPLCRKT